MRFLTACIALLCLAPAAPAQPNSNTGSVIQLDPHGRPPRERGDIILVWLDDAGWHLRSYPGAKERVSFSGTIRVIDGRVSGVYGVEGLESPGGKGKKRKKRAADAGVVSRDDKTIQFKMNTVSGGEDGFNFQVTRPTTAVEFTILVNGLDHPEKVRIGASGRQPPGATFVLPYPRPGEK
jgi:hypothetical protein